MKLPNLKQITENYGSNLFDFSNYENVSHILTPRFGAGRLPELAYENVGFSFDLFKYFLQDQLDYISAEQNEFKNALLIFSRTIKKTTEIKSDMSDLFGGPKETVYFSLGIAAASLQNSPDFFRLPSNLVIKESKIATLQAFAANPERNVINLSGFIIRKNIAEWDWSLPMRKNHTHANDAKDLTYLAGYFTEYCLQLCEQYYLQPVSGVNLKSRTDAIKFLFEALNRPLPKPQNKYEPKL